MTSKVSALEWISLFLMGICGVLLFCFELCNLTTLKHLVGTFINPGTDGDLFSRFPQNGSSHFCCHIADSLDGDRLKLHGPW